MTPTQAAETAPGARARLFVAVVPPPDAVARLRDDVVRAGLDGLRPVPPAQWHVTLAFMPAVPEHLVGAAAGCVARTAAAHPPFTLRLAGSGRFADRVVWVGVDGDTGALAAAAGELRAALLAAGVEVDEQAFHPHLTVARGSNRDRRAVRAAVEALASHDGPAWTVDDLRLIRSRPGPRGAQHQEVARGAFAR